MKNNVLVFVLYTLIIVNVKSQVFNNSNAKIGIDEHLGKMIPLNLKFSSEHGDSITLGQIIDKPTVLSFVYFDCPGLCSPLQQGISEVIDKSDLVIGKDYKVITISFNYKDDPVKAEKKKKNFAQCISKNKCEYWYYLTSDSTTINKIMKAVGYKVKVTGVDFAHPSGIVVVSDKGMITRYLYGVTFLPIDFKMSIIEASKGLPRPTISKVLDFCFAYDPASKRYALQVTKISASLIILFALFLLGYLILKPKRKIITN
jgi:protein SCO1